MWNCHGGVPPFRLVWTCICRWFEGTLCRLMVLEEAFKMAANYCYEWLVRWYQTARRYIQQDSPVTALTLRFSFGIFRAKRWMHYLHTCYMPHPARSKLLSSPRCFVKSAQSAACYNSYDPPPALRDVGTEIRHFPYKAQWSLYVPHDGHYVYLQWSLYVPHSGHYMYRTVVTICTAWWSLCVPFSGHYMYRTVVTICTAQWSPYVPHSGHCMYRTVVTVCTAQWSHYVPHSGHCMYRTVVNVCTGEWSLYVPPV